MLSKLCYPLVILSQVLTFFLFSCSNIECPLNNAVGLELGLYDAATDTNSTFNDYAISVKLISKDSLLLNQATELKRIKLPLRYESGIDSIEFTFSNSDAILTDTLCIAHNCLPHFESVDCPVVMFHTLTNVMCLKTKSSTTTSLIDSIVITNPNINYDGKENIRLFLRLHNTK